MAQTKNEGKYEVSPSPLRMTEHREIAEVTKPQGAINVLRQTNLSVHKNVIIPVPIPLLKGSMGWRIFLINKDTQKLLDSPTAMKKLLIGVGSGWADKPVFAGNGYQILTSTSYEGLFGMLNIGRFKLLPRGINEVWKEFQARKNEFPKMAIEKTLVIRYKLLEYFWVGKHNKKLAKRIEQGLKKLSASGEMDRIFDKHFQRDMLPLNLKGRYIVDIESDEFTSNINTPDKEYLMEAYLKKKGIKFKKLNFSK